MGDNYFLLTNLLSEDERRVITSITSHIERGEKRVGIQQIANENFLSTTSIVKMCKRLGFDGYSELYYHLSRQLASSGDRKAENLKSLIDNYDDELTDRFCALLTERCGEKMFTTGEGFSQHRWDLYHAPAGHLRLQGLQQCAFLRLYAVPRGAARHSE